MFFFSFFSEPTLPFSKVKMACGRVENCSDQLCLAPAILPQNEYLSELDQFLDYNSNKKRFLWNGNTDDLGKFIEDNIVARRG